MHAAEFDFFDVYSCIIDDVSCFMQFIFHSSLEVGYSFTREAETFDLQAFQNPRTLMDEQFKH